MKVDPKHIPPEVVEAAYNAYWHEKPNSGFREAIAAALAAWPGVTLVPLYSALEPALALPLPPQEASDV